MLITMPEKVADNDDGSCIRVVKMMALSHKTK